MRQNALVVVLLAVVVALAVMVVRQRSEIADLKEVAQVVPSKHVVLAEPPAPLAPKEEPVPLFEPPPAEPALAAASNTNAAGNFMSGLVGMMKDPQMKEMIRSQQTMALNQMYGSLFEDLNLQASEMDALKELLLERQMALTEAGMAMMSGTTEDRKKAAEATKAIKDDYDKKFQDLLGPQNYEVFEQHEQTTNERMQVRMFKGALPATAALSDEQKYDLIAAMYEERKALPTSALLNNKTTDPSQLTEEGIAEALKEMERLQQRYAERAGMILSPEQLEQFTKWQQQWSAMQAAGLKMASQMFGNKTPPPPGGPSTQAP